MLRFFMEGGAEGSYTSCHFGFVFRLSLFCIGLKSLYVFYYQDSWLESLNISIWLSQILARSLG